MEQTIIIAQASIKPVFTGGRYEGLLVKEEPKISHLEVTKLNRYKCWEYQNREAIDRMCNKELRVTRRETIMKADLRVPTHTLLIYYNPDSKNFWVADLYPGKMMDRSKLRKGVAWNEHPVYFHEWTIEDDDDGHRAPHAIVEHFDGRVETVRLNDFYFVI